MTLTKYALYRMIYETCGEDREMLETIHIDEVSPNVFHITYKEYDPYDGVDLKVKISIVRELREDRYRDVALFSVFNSVYGDDGDFEIVL